MKYYDTAKVVETSIFFFVDIDMSAILNEFRLFGFSAHWILIDRRSNCLKLQKSKTCLYYFR